MSFCLRAVWIISLSANAWGGEWLPRTIEGMYYPCIARKQHLGGPVLIRCTLDANGLCTHADVLRGHLFLIEEAKQNAQHWKFKYGGSSSSKQPFVELTYTFISTDHVRPAGAPEYRFVFELPNRITVTADQDPDAKCVIYPKHAVIGGKH